MRPPSPALRIHAPEDTPARPEAGPGPSSARFLVNGWPADVLIWTAEAWARLESPPEDAHRLEDGSRVALRIA